MKTPVFVNVCGQYKYCFSCLMHMYSPCGRQRVHFAVFAARQRAAGPSRGWILAFSRPATKQPLSHCTNTTNEQTDDLVLPLWFHAQMNARALAHYLAPERRLTTTCLPLAPHSAAGPGQNNNTSSPYNRKIYVAQITLQIAAKLAKYGIYYSYATSYRLTAWQRLSDRLHSPL